MRSHLAKLEAALWTFGIGALSYCAFTVADRHAYQMRQQERLEALLVAETVEQMPGATSPAPYVRPLAAGKKTGAAARSRNAPARRAAARKTDSPVAKADDPKMIGRILIPRIGVSAIVRSGVDNETLRRAVGHIPETDLPGGKGNVGMAAHRDTFFRGLRNIKLNDLIRVQTPKGTFEYIVEATTIVDPENVEVLDPLDYPVLTLVTCFPFDYIGNAPRRFIVRARMVTKEPDSVPGS